MWKGKSMTEKSEDQVVWVYENSKGCRFCGQKLHASKVNPCDPNNMPHKDLYTARFCKEYVPHSKYLALKSDLAVAVEALTSLVGHTEATLQFPHKDKIDLVMSLDRAKEALSKIRLNNGN